MRRSIIWIIATALALAACSGAGSGELADRFEDGAEGLEAPADTAAGEPDALAVGVPGTAGVASGTDQEGAKGTGGFATEAALTFPAGSIDLKIIRNATLDVRVEVGSFEVQWAELRRIAADAGGYIADATTGVYEGTEDDEYAFGTATLRVPADRFDDVVESLGGLGDRLDFSMSSQDVSEEYVDIEARLRHWRTTEQFFVSLLAEAETTADALAVKQELDGVQLTIEQLEGRLRYLDNRTALSSISVTMTEAPGELPPPPSPDDPSILSEALEQAGAVILGIFSFLIVATAAVVPVAMLALAIYLAWRMGRRLTASRQAGSEA